jgi:hypothetical protein
VAAPAEPDGPGRRPASTIRVTGAVLVVLATLEAATVECFFVPLRTGRWPLPVSAVAAVVGNVLLARLIVAVTGWRPAALLPPVLWLVVVLAFAAPRAEGDLIVPGTWPGLAFLFLGTIAGAYGAASSIAPRRRRAPADPSFRG